MADDPRESDAELDFVIPRETHVRLFAQAREAAEVDEETTVFFFISGPPPENEAEVVYIAPPDPDRLNYAALHAVGMTRLYQYRALHRFAAYREVADAPEGAIATELRHELQHAKHFDQMGPAWIEVDRILRDLARASAALSYEDVPSERDANVAAGAFAAEHYEDDVDAMAADERFRQYTGEIRPIGSLLAETLAEIWQIADRNQIDDHTGRPRAEVVDELAAGAEQWREDVAAGADYRVRRAEGQSAVVDVPRPG